MERHFSQKTFGTQDVLCACARRGYRVNDCTLHWNFLVTPAVFFTEFCLLLFFVTFVCLSFHEYFLKLLNRQNNIHGKGIQVSHLISRHQCSMIHVYMPHDSPYVNLQLGFVSTIEIDLGQKMQIFHCKTQAVGRNSRSSRHPFSQIWHHHKPMFFISCATHHTYFLQHRVKVSVGIDTVNHARTSSVQLVQINHRL